ncbi:unnamed protein product [Closterium sp. NIES-53]
MPSPSRRSSCSASSPPSRHDPSTCPALLSSFQAHTALSLPLPNLSTFSPPPCTHLLHCTFFPAQRVCAQVHSCQRSFTVVASSTPPFSHADPFKCFSFPSPSHPFRSAPLVLPRSPIHHPALPQMPAHLDRFLPHDNSFNFFYPPSPCLPIFYLPPPASLPAPRFTTPHCDISPLPFKSFNCFLLPSPSSLPLPLLQPHSPSPSPRFTTLLSDMCPSTSGASPSDVAASHSLALRALALAAQPLHTHSEPHSTQPHHIHLKPDAHLLPWGHDRSHPDPAYSDTGVVGSRGRGARESAGEAAREAGAAAGAEAERAAAWTGPVAAAEAVEGPSARVRGGREAEGRSVEGRGEGGAAAQGGVLAVGGHMVVKLLEGDDTPVYVAACRQLFSSVTRLRPKATRVSSREIYVIAKGFRPRGSHPQGFAGF